MSILSNLYDYQKEAVESTLKSKKGIIVLPTGTGKTYCQAAIIANDILNHRNSFRIYVVNAPRILLTYQLLKEVYSVLVNSGIDARYHLVHSGTAVDESELETVRVLSNVDGNSINFSEIDATTSVSKTYEIIEKAKSQNLPIIIFSTYNSAENIEIARLMVNRPISIILNDEAHYLVQERFYDILHTLYAERCYFFTATTKHTPSDTGRGMNNFESYGSILYYLSPREAIEKGKMVRPRIQLVKSEGYYVTEDFDKSLSLFILNSYQQHKKHFEDNHNGLNPKILISARGSNDIKLFLNSSEYDNLRGLGVDIFAISSVDNIGNDVNGKKVKRQEFLRILKEYGGNPDKKMIVIHFDILTEGIDVPGFTSCMPLRALNKGRFVQTFGRCSRLDLKDKFRMNSGEILPNDLDKMFKPFAYIILPLITNTNQDDSEYIRQIVTELREYGFSPHEDIIGDVDVRGIAEDDNVDGLNEILKREKTTGDLIDEVYSEFEMEEIAKLSPLEYLERHLND